MPSTRKLASLPDEISSKSSRRVPNIDQASHHCLANEDTHTHTHKQIKHGVVKTRRKQSNPSIAHLSLFSCSCWTFLFHSMEGITTYIHEEKNNTGVIHIRYTHMTYL
jgi:hypothetical protein